MGQSLIPMVSLIQALVFFSIAEQELHNMLGPGDLILGVGHWFHEHDFKHS